MAINLLSASSKANTVDSLLTHLSSVKEDSSKVDIYNDIGLAYLEDKKWPQALIYISKSDSIAETINYQQGIVTAKKLMGHIYYYQGEYQQALNNYYRCLNCAKKDSIPSTLSHLYNWIGVTYRAMGQYEEALINYFFALKYDEQTEDHKDLVNIQNNIGVIYRTQKKNELALTSYLKALKACKAQKNEFKTVISLMNIGACYQDLGNITKAEKYRKKALEIAKHKEDKLLLLHSYNNMGSLYEYKGNIDSALIFFSNALQLSKKMAWKGQMAITYINVGRMHSLQKHYIDALAYIKNGLEMAKENKQLEYIQMAYKELVKIYDIKQDWGKAYYYNKALLEIKDTLNRDVIINKLEELKALYEVDQQQQQIKLLSQKNEIQSLLLSQKNLWIGSLLLALILIIIIGILIFRQYQLKSQHQTLVIRQKMLMLQMNPHFMFNSLTSIQSWILENEENALIYLSRLANLMRQILQNSRKEFISISEEVDTLNNYLSLQKIRFEDKLNYDVYIDPAIDSNNVMLPPMLGQPFIENAIEHGYSDDILEQQLYIRITKFNNSLKYEIEDNGKGLIKNNTRDNNHLSLAITITKERLDLLQRDHPQLKNNLEIINKKDKNPIEHGVIIVFYLPISYS